MLHIQIYWIVNTFSMEKGVSHGIEICTLFMEPSLGMLHHANEDKRPLLKNGKNNRCLRVKRWKGMFLSCHVTFQDHFEKTSATILSSWTEFVMDLLESVWLAGSVLQLLRCFKQAHLYSDVMSQIHIFHNHLITWVWDFFLSFSFFTVKYFGLRILPVLGKLN